MYEGDFEAAWRQTDRIEQLRRASAPRVREPYHLLWDGNPLAGRNVLVRCEHGLGDSIQYLRYCAPLRKIARRVVVRVQPALLDLLQGMDGIDELVDAWTMEPDPPHEVAIECMELAYAFRHKAADVPKAVPYLPVERLRLRTPPILAHASDRTRVGLIWAASAWNPRRSMPLRALVPLGCCTKIDYFSLQQGPERAEVLECPFPLVDLSPHTTGAAEAAGAMLALDLIITVDGMTAHLAGALGRPVWLLLTHEADWRWLGTGKSSPWYPTMRVFRQSMSGEWAGLVEEVTQNLAGLVRSRKDALCAPGRDGCYTERQPSAGRGTMGDC